MKLRFSINYRAEWGQQLVVDLRYDTSDGSQRRVQHSLQTQDGELWSGETSIVESRRNPVRSFCYTYFVADGSGNELRREWEGIERSFPFDPTKTFVMYDQWRDRPLAYHLYSQAYATTTGRRQPPAGPSKPLSLYRRTLLFSVSAPQLRQGETLALIGSHPSLGAWSPARYLPMEETGQHVWAISINADALQLPIEYKYVVVDANTRQLKAWEEGDNRCYGCAVGDGEVHVLNGDNLRVAETPWRVAGVCVPVFSLRSDHSFGVGDFGDLYRFVDWVALTGMKLVQLLPVCDTTCTHEWGDSYPYNIVSAFALHPHYIDIGQLEQSGPVVRTATYKRRQRELNALKVTDYVAVDEVKMAYVRQIYAKSGARTLASASCRQWAEANSYWLDGYCEWLGEEHDYTVWLQYNLHVQLTRAAGHARELGIALKGDLPIGVNGNSAETTDHPQFFNMGQQTGAPPDVFARQGQNWGFPTYNWSDEEAISDWFRRRMAHLEQYFDALRIDHVLGFFRIWTVPAEQIYGTMGHFSPALPLSADEIEQYGLHFRRDFLTLPFINDRIVDTIFGIHANYVRDEFLRPMGYGLYALREAVATQKAVRKLFDGRTDENSLWIRDGLCQLVANVLFLADPDQPDRYHPRIAAYQEPVFEVLSNEERDAFMRIYNNYYYQRHTFFWGGVGHKRLNDVLRDTRMLICAEDLGMLPDCVAPVLDDLRVLTLEIQQMPKRPGSEFAHLEANPVRSVATITTHDMAPLRQWWEENTERTQRYFNSMMQKSGRAPETLPAHLAEEIVARHLYSPSMICVLALQDWLATDSDLRNKNSRGERINVPSDPHNKWQWRMHIGIEDLMKADKFNKKLFTMIERSKRDAAARQA